MTKNAPIADSKSPHDETHDAWFRRKVQEGLDLASSPEAKWYTHEEVMARSAIRRAEIMATIKNKDAS